MIRAARAFVVLTITLSVAGACAAIVLGRVVVGHIAAAKLVTREYIAQCGAEPDIHLSQIHYFGVIADRKPGTTSYINFIASAHPHNKPQVTPTIIDYFVKFGAPWDPVPACYAVHHGALPLLQVDLYKQNLATIANGGANNYIVHFAQQVKAFGLPVVLSLGHEMNGNWYPWGWKNHNSYHKGSGVDPKIFVAFWQKVHQLFAAQKVYNVIWLWTVNRAVNPATNPIAWWPGKQYVDWVGIDGHYTYPSDRFSNVFGPTIAEVRSFTHDPSLPILIAESAIKKGPQRTAQIADLYNTVFRTKGLIGVIYFDMHARFHWQLDDQASLSAFWHAVQPYEVSALQPTKHKKG